MKAECRMRNVECGPRLASRRSGSPLATRGFTMIEIAISLAVIGFALVAIIGILPTGMNVQKQNRQETIINQDATMLLDGIRNGARGMDDLTNYIVAITNSYTIYGPTRISGRNWYTYGSSSTTPDSLLLTNGLHIIGLLSTPKFIILPSPTGRGFSYISNHVVAYVRSISGSAADKAPINYSGVGNPVQDLAFSLGFSYRLVSDVVPYFGYETNGLPKGAPGVPLAAPDPGLDYMRYRDNYQANMHDLRLTFLWPLLPNGSAGPGRQVFRSEANSMLIWTNEFSRGSGALTWTNSLAQAALPTTLFFFQPRTYFQVQTP